MFKLEKDFHYLMPVQFGGGKFDKEIKITQRSISLTISYETDKAMLENYLPDGFELLKEEVQLDFGQHTQVSWMYGGQYNWILVGVPVRFHGKKDELEGFYPLVVWENKAAAIIGGREETGIPKVFADIEDLHILKPYYVTSGSYEGNTFLNMNFEATGDINGKELEEVKSQFASRNYIGWRYIPKVGAPGAELSQFILYPGGFEVETAQIGNSSLKWTEMNPMQNPLQHSIINSLASLPIKKINSAILSKGRTTLHSNGAKVIE
jgi:acetoacetate decarboxylase